MLATVEYGGVKKFIKIPQIDENFDFQKFLQQVTDKFSLQAELGTEGGLHLFDTSDTEVDADIFDELIKSGVENFKIGYRQCPEPSTSSSSSSDCTKIPSTMENRKRATEDWDHYGAKQKTLDPVSSPSSAANLTPKCWQRWNMEQSKNISKFYKLRKTSTSRSFFNKATVKYGGAKKYIRIPQIDENVDFQKFLQQVIEKFSLQAQLVTEGGLHLFDTSDTEVEADTFDELIKSGVRDFKVGYRHCPDPSPSSLPVPSASTSVPDCAAPSPSSSSSSDCTNILLTSKNSKDLNHNEAKQETVQLLDPVLSSPLSAASMAAKALMKLGCINDKMCIELGSPTIYQLTPKIQMFGSLKKITFGKKNPNMKNKAILLVGETGTGKSTLTNALMNQALGVQWEDDVWFHFVENHQQSDGQQRNQADSQTSDVIVYQLFGFEGKPLPCSLTIIDTPGYGDTRGTDRDDIVKLRLLELFSSDEGVHEISAVGLVLQASVNRVSDRLSYIFDSVMSLFGKDMEKNIVALLTHSDGLPPKNVLRALEDANVKLAKDEDNEPVYFLFNNCQHLQRTKNFNFALKAAWDKTMSGMIQFREFVDKTPPQNNQKTVEVLDTRNRLKTAIQNLKERSTWTEMQQKTIFTHSDHEHLWNILRQFTMEQQVLEEAYDHLMKLEKIALNQNAASTRVHLDFLTDKMKEKGDTQKVEKLEEIRNRMDKANGSKAAF